MGCEAIILGVGDAFSTRHWPTALLLVADGFHLAIDCPDRYGAALASASTLSGRPLDLGAIDDFLITHVHGDHINGLEAVGFFKHLVEHRRARLHAAAELLDRVWPERLRLSMGTLFDGQRHVARSFTDYFVAEPLREDCDNVIGPFHVRVRATLHHVPTLALLVEYQDRRLGYSADTAFDPALLDFLAPAEIIIHETNFGPAHTGLEKLLALPPALRAKLRLIHYPDTLDPAAVGVSVLREGEVLTLCP